MRSTSRRIWPAYAALLCLLFALLWGNLRAGSVEIDRGTLMSLLLNRNGEKTALRILWEIRLPRMLCAALLGGALALSGYLLQVFFGNPIAGPFVLGISSGAKLTVAMTLVYFLSRGRALPGAVLVSAAFAGALAAMGTVLLLSRRIERMSALIVCGVMIGYLCSAVTEFLITFADDANIVNLHSWSMGSFSGMRWENVGVITALVLPVLLGCIALSKPMQAYLLGEAYAGSMGVSVQRLRLWLILLSSLLSALVTAYAGPISFVGIAVPHLMKRLFRTARPLVLLPACFLGGADFCLLCDLLCRTLFAPAEVSVSAVTAVFGAPVVVWAVLSRERGGEHG